MNPQLIVKQCRAKTTSYNLSVKEVQRHLRERLKSGWEKGDARASFVAWSS